MFNFMQHIQWKVARREHGLTWRHASFSLWPLDGFLDCTRVSGFRPKNNQAIKLIGRTA